jgi:large subunit ribosomal protein L25
MANELQAEKRDESGKGAAHKLRAGGRVPGVLYGHGMDPVPLSVDAREMRHILHTGAGTNVLIDLEVDGKQHLTLPREIQQDHIHDRVMHVDFLVVRRDEKISVNVELIDIGDAPGVKQGGVVDHHLRELHIECLPQDVPEHIEVDISGLDLGDIVHVSDLVAPKGVTILNGPDETVLAVITPAALKTEAELTLPGEEAAAPVEVPEEGEEGAEEPGAEAASGEPAAEEGGES